MSYGDGSFKAVPGDSDSTVLEKIAVAYFTYGCEQCPFRKIAEICNGNKVLCPFMSLSRRHLKLERETTCSECGHRYADGFCEVFERNTPENGYCYLGIRIDK